MKRIKGIPIMKKVEIIKIPYKPFRKTLYEYYSKISLINLSKKSYVNFRGTGILGNPLLTLSE